MEGVRQQHKPYRNHDDGHGALGEELAALNGRLDELTQQIKRIAQSTPSRRFGAGVPGAASTDRLAEALARLDRRLDQVIDEGRLIPHRLPERKRHADAAPAASSPSAARQRPAEWATQIAARQHALDCNASPGAASAEPRPAQLDLTGLEQQLTQIATDVAALKQPHEASLAALRQELAEIGRAVANAVPRQSIEAIETQVRSVARRIDEIGAPSQVGGGAEALKQLEEAVVSLRSVMSNAASEGTVAQLATEVHGLTSRLERAAAENGREVIGSLEARIAKLTEKLDATDSRLGHLGGIERSTAELLALVEKMRGSAPSGPHAAPVADVPAEKPAPKPLQSSAAVPPVAPVHDAPGERTPEPPSPSALGASPLDLIPAEPDQLPPEPPAFASMSPLDLVAAGTAQIAPEPSGRLLPLDLIPGTDEPESAPSPPVPSTLTQMLAAHSAPKVEKQQPQPGNEQPRLEPRRPIDPDLPPDTPIEPGAGVPRVRTASAAVRIAASEALLGGMRPRPEPTGGRSAAIAAARNAAKEAALELSDKGPKSPASGSLPLFEWFKKARNAQPLPAQPTQPAMVRPNTDDSAGQAEASGNRILRRLKKILVAASVAIIVLGASQMALDLLLPGDPDEHTSPPAVDVSAGAGSDEPPRTADAAQAALPASAPVSDITGVIEREPSFAHPADAVAPQAESAISVPPPTAPWAGKANPPAAAAVEPKSTALQGGIAAKDPAAEYEMGSRYADGRGVPQDLREAARWLELAANANFVPAQFRLAGLIEKGEGVKKDVQTARRLYLSAANRGHAKSMHNLAVLYAEGADGKPDYAAAAQWFRKAAAYGIADSQYNLAILYARGIGVQANLAESYKWFAIAAGRGDQDAATKRDEVAARLDAQTLMAANLAVQTFAVEREPDEATNLRTPPGGWDRTLVQAAKPRPRAAVSPTQ
jgi:localization factor PodJL